MSVKRVTLSLPIRVLDDLDFVSKTLGLSRSSFVSGMLSSSLPPLVPICHNMSSKDSSGDSKRYRGDAKEEIKTLVQNLQDLAEGISHDDLFKK